MKLSLLKSDFTKFPALLFALTASCLGGEIREWTSVDGRVLKGEFVSVDATGVIIKTEDFRTVKIPAELVSGDDAVFVTRLHEEMELEKQKQEEAAAAAARKEKFLDGPLTYTLAEGWQDWPEDRYNQIVEAMDAGVAFLNEHGHFKKEVFADNVPSVPTADGNYNGNIRWGGYINRRVALHELSHTLGIGTHPKWISFVKDGKWTGEHALKQLREFDGPNAELNADLAHFWPYGLNHDPESSEVNDLRFVKMLVAFRKDMGIK